MTIDYPRGRFYFEAFQPDNEINNQCNNFDLTVKDGDLYVSTVWSSTKGKIEVGDKVIKINGKPAKKYDFCESILNGIPELKEKKQTKLTIETASGIKNIIYKKEWHEKNRNTDRLMAAIISKLRTRNGSANPE